MPEVWGDAALLVSPSCCEDIAATIEKILNNSLLRQDLVNKGYENAKKYSWDASAEDFYHVLRRLD